MALGRFASSLVARPRFLARHQLRDRLARIERRGGWPTLARTPVADVAGHLWRRRESMLARVEALPQVPQHGDPAPVNLPGRGGHHRVAHAWAVRGVVAIDWAMLGLGHVGSDLGLYALAAREDFEPLVEAYLMGLAPDVATAEEVVTGARVTVVYTALSRAEWALERVSGGEGALVSKFRHPAVAPHLRALQRQFPQVEALLEG